MRDNVTLIPARKRPGNRIAKQEEKPKFKVAAYCRVSTDSDEQAGSYETQVAHYTEYITKNPEWELAGIYADDGISGTNTKKREQFNVMIDDCMAGKIDRIITKSISRFARNTLDCLKYVRQLRDKNIDIYFEKENIHTLEADADHYGAMLMGLESDANAVTNQMGHTHDWHATAEKASSLGGQRTDEVGDKYGGRQCDLSEIPANTITLWMTSLEHAMLYWQSQPGGMSSPEAVRAMQMLSGKKLNVDRQHELLTMLTNAEAAYLNP